MIYWGWWNHKEWGQDQFRQELHCPFILGGRLWRRVIHPKVRYNYLYTYSAVVAVTNVTYAYFTSGSVFCRASAGCDGPVRVHPSLPPPGMLISLVYLHYTLLVSGHTLDRTCGQVTAMFESEVEFVLGAHQIFSCSVAATREKKSGCQESASDLCSGIRAFLRFRCCCSCRGFCKEDCCCWQ